MFIYVDFTCFSHFCDIFIATIVNVEFVVHIGMKKQTSESIVLEY